MKLFPTQYSTLSAQALNDHLKSAFGLDGITTTFLVRNVSDTYLIAAGEPKYILKIYRSKHRSRNQIQGEVDLLNYLCENGAKVAYPIADKRGTYLQPFETGEGVRYGVLYAYAKGKVANDLTVKQLQVLGKEIAFNHDLLSGQTLTIDRPDYNLITTVQNPVEALQHMFKRFDYPEGQVQLQEVATRTIARYESLDTSSFAHGYCHYDYMPKNFHYSGQDEMTLFDFDFAGKGWLVNDLMSFQVHFFFKILFGAMSKVQAAEDFQVFITAYREHRDISEAELNAIPVLGVMYWIFYLAVHYHGFDDFANPYFNRDFIKRWLGRIEQWEALYF